MCSWLSFSSILHPLGRLCRTHIVILSFFNGWTHRVVFSCTGWTFDTYVPPFPMKGHLVSQLAEKHHLNLFYLIVYSILFHFILFVFLHFLSISRQPYSKLIKTNNVSILWAIMEDIRIMFKLEDGWMGTGSESIWTLLEFRNPLGHSNFFCFPSFRRRKTYPVEIGHENPWKYMGVHGISW